MADIVQMFSIAYLFTENAHIFNDSCAMLALYVSIKFLLNEIPLKLVLKGLID